MFKGVGIIFLVLSLAACGAPRSRPAAEAPAQAAPEPPRAFHIDSERSELRILVYRAGPLARFGHNHVMVNRKITGTVNPAEVPLASTFHLSIPVGDFVVDDAQARREEGADFAAAVPDDARSGTLHNMLSPAVLDADQFPVISLSSASPLDPAQFAAGQGATVKVAVDVAGHRSMLDVPLTVISGAHQITASGTLELRQSALGLTPYSLMLGALQVQDSLTIKFSLVATDGAAATVSKTTVPSGASSASAG